MIPCERERSGGNNPPAHCLVAAVQHTILRVLVLEIVLRVVLPVARVRPAVRRIDGGCIARGLCHPLFPCGRIARGSRDGARLQPRLALDRGDNSRTVQGRSRVVILGHPADAGIESRSSRRDHGAFGRAHVSAGRVVFRDFARGRGDVDLSHFCSPSEKRRPGWLACHLLKARFRDWQHLNRESGKILYRAGEAAGRQGRPQAGKNHAKLIAVRPMRTSGEQKRENVFRSGRTRRGTNRLYGQKKAPSVDAQHCCAWEAPGAIKSRSGIGRFLP